MIIKKWTSFNGSLSVQTAHWLHAGDVNWQTAATVPAPSNGDAQGEPWFLLQTHSLLLAGEAAGRILQPCSDKSKQTNKHTDQAEIKMIV